MATKLVIDKEQGAAFIRRTGHINPGEMLEVTKGLESNPFFKNIRKSLSYVSAADFSDISANEFEFHAQMQLANGISSWQPRTVRAS